MVLEVYPKTPKNVDHASGESGIVGAKELVDDELGASSLVDDGQDKQFKQGSCAQLMSNKQLLPKAPLPLLILSMPPNESICCCLARFLKTSSWRPLAPVCIAPIISQKSSNIKQDIKNLVR